MSSKKRPNRKSTASKKPAKSNSVIRASALDRDRNGRVVTFYSYKGGTGRTMALANVAWILASNGKQVLLIDWDLEAPGLHRYFRPFLEDPELISSPGLIDFLAEFSEGARLAALGRATSGSPSTKTSSSDTASSAPWYEEYSDLLRFAVSVDHEFPSDGVIDIIPAGRQGASYGMLVNSMHWDDFYNKLGGGVFLESVKEQLRKEYDYILIDSRTGLSDTAGICTVQMPDELVVCFTLNRQSIDGAAAVAESASRARRKPSGEPGLKTWPIPMRVELAEKDRLDAARTLTKDRFSSHLWHLTRRERVAYWERIEVLYFPYYAYEEVLATIADSPRRSSTLLSAMEIITRNLTAGGVQQLADQNKRERLDLLHRYVATDRSSSSEKTDGQRIYLSYTKRDIRPEQMRGVVDMLKKRLPTCNFFWDELVPLGSNLETYLQGEMARANIVVVFLGPAGLTSNWTKKETHVALDGKKVLVPVFVDPGSSEYWPSLPIEIRALRGVHLPNIEQWTEKTLEPLAEGLERLIGRLPASPPLDPDDPQKGRWGEKSRKNGRELSATVFARSKHWFDVTLIVKTVSGKPLTGPVTFHLHSSFSEDVHMVEAVDGVATIHIQAWGAFTAGAVIEDGTTTLELDLAEISQAPKEFRER